MRGFAFEVLFAIAIISAVFGAVYVVTSAVLL